MQENPDFQEKKETEKDVSEAPYETESASGKETKIEAEPEVGAEVEPEVKIEEKSGEETEEKTEEETGEKAGEEKRAYTMERRLTKSRTNHMLFGVCGGLGEYFEIDPTLVRLAFVFLTLANGIGMIIYIVLAIIMPSEEEIAIAPESRGGSPKSTREKTELTENIDKSDRNRFLGAILLIIGIYLLLDRLSIFRIFWWLDELFLPAILILGGAWLLLKYWK